MLLRKDVACSLGFLLLHLQHVLALQLHLSDDLLSHFGDFLSLYPLNLQLKLLSFTFLFLLGLLLGFAEKLFFLALKLYDSLGEVLFTLRVDSAHLGHLFLMEFLYQC